MIACQSVLFVCSLNSIRSPMAEGILRYLGKQVIFVDSAGVRRGSVDGFMVRVMDEIGLDMGGHVSKSLADLEDDSFDCIITLSPEAHHHAIEFARFLPVEPEFWNVPDPSGTRGTQEQRLEAYREVRDHLFARIRTHFYRGTGGL